MKSKKAKAIIRENDFYFSIDGVAFHESRAMMKRDAVKAVELAEQEAEERMREKAIKAHRACCPLNELQCIHRDRDDYTCTYDCRYVTSFIQKMTEQ